MAGRVLAVIAVVALFWYLGSLARSPRGGGTSGSSSESRKTTSEARNPGANYVLPDSDSVRLSPADLQGLDHERLRLARNEIYARHGCMFHDSELDQYFRSCAWYRPVPGRLATSFQGLTPVEKSNVSLIQQFERSTGSTASSSRPEGGSSSAGPSTEYVIPDSDRRALTDDDVRRLSLRELELARNEIYARHGCTFRRQDLQQYFQRKSWYRPVPGRSALAFTGMSPLEKQNVDRIRAAERSRRGS